MQSYVKAMDQVKEGPIDERYRLLLLDRYLKNVKEVPVAGGGSKWVFCCPFCSSLGRTEAKRNERKGALLWNDLQNSWVFFCVRHASTECFGGGKTLGNLVSAINPALAEGYKRDRWHSGTTGKGHNCGSPEGIMGMNTGY